MVHHLSEGAFILALVHIAFAVGMSRPIFLAEFLPCAIVAALCSGATMLIHLTLTLGRGTIPLVPMLRRCVWHQEIIMLRTLALLFVCTPAIAGMWSPPINDLRTNHDGTQVWTLSMDTSDLSKADRSLTQSDLDQKIVSSTLGWKGWCQKGWEITSSRVEKKRLIIEGRCLS